MPDSEIVSTLMSQRERLFLASTFTQHANDGIECDLQEMGDQLSFTIGEKGVTSDIQGH